MKSLCIARRVAPSSVIITMLRQPRRRRDGGGIDTSARAAQFPECAYTRVSVIRPLARRVAYRFGRRQRRNAVMKKKKNIEKPPRAPLCTVRVSCCIQVHARGGGSSEHYYLLLLRVLLLLLSSSDKRARTHSLTTTKRVDVHTTTIIIIIKQQYYCYTYVYIQTVCLLETPLGPPVPSTSPFCRHAIFGCYTHHYVYVCAHIV